jgi:hypothetical protein
VFLTSSSLIFGQLTIVLPFSDTKISSEVLFKPVHHWRYKYSKFSNSIFGRHKFSQPVKYNFFRDGSFASSKVSSTIGVCLKSIIVHQLKVSNFANSSGGFYGKKILDAQVQFGLMKRFAIDTTLY